jgi:hypothetical protein
VAGYNVVVNRELTLHDQAVLEARAFEIVAIFGPTIAATDKPPGPAGAWREVEDSTGFVVSVTADSERTAIEQVQVALDADDAANWEVHRLAV